MAQDCPPLGEVQQRSEEGEPSGLMQRKQPRDEEPSEQFAVHAHWKQEGRPRRYPA